MAVAKPPQAAANATDQQPLKAAESATGTDTRAGRDTSDRWREAAQVGGQIETTYYLVEIAHMTLALTPSLSFSSSQG